MQRVLQWVFFLVLRTLHATYRYRIFNLDQRELATKAHPKGAIAIGVWHGNSLAATLAHTWQKFCPLCSQSPDGQMVAFLCKNMGLFPVSGSSSRGGKEARQELMDRLADGYSAAITVDGPKGPPLKAKPGIVDLAKKTGVAILPATAYPDRYWQLGSWDRLKVPKPFARIAVIYAPPFEVPESVEGDQFDEYLDRLNQSLIELDKSFPKALEGWKAEGIPLRRGMFT